MRTCMICSLAAVMTLVLFACGGGGGSGDSAGGGSVTSGINYTGETRMAVITEDNATDLALGSYQSGQSGAASANPLASLSQQQPDQQLPSRTLSLSGALRGIAGRLDIVGNLSPSTSRELAHESDTVSGPCGGRALVSMTGDTETGTFNGSIDMQSYCEDDVTMTGGIDLSGRINLYTATFTRLDMTFNSLDVEACGDRFTTTGNLGYAFGGSEETLTMNMLLREASSGKVYRVADQVYTYLSGYSYEQLSISGRYYDPDHGYAELSTPEPLRIYRNEYWPSAGVLLAQGDNGTSARLTTFAGGTFQVEADTTGDGHVNLTETLAWDTDICAY